MGAAKGTQRPLSGTSKATTVINLVTGAATGESSGQLSQLGAVTGSAEQQFALLGSGFGFTGTGTTVAANGDKLLISSSGTGTLGPPIQTTGVVTITGGTGRFADASGTFTNTGQSTSISIVGSTETVTSIITTKGTISY
jgi:hypothetical protein